MLEKVVASSVVVRYEAREEDGEWFEVGLLGPFAAVDEVE